MKESVYLIEKIYLNTFWHIAIAKARDKKISGFG